MSSFRIDFLGKYLLINLAMQLLLIFPFFFISIKLKTDIKFRLSDLLMKNYFLHYSIASNNFSSASKIWERAKEIFEFKTTSADVILWPVAYPEWCFYNTLCQSFFLLFGNINSRNSLYINYPKLFPWRDLNSKHNYLEVVYISFFSKNGVRVEA